MEGIIPIASGSKGNCTYIGTGKTRLLVDVGLSARLLQKRLKPLGIDLETIDAILITHEHSDHICGLKTLIAQYNIPVFCNIETAKSIVTALGECPRFKIFVTGEPFIHADLTLLPFSILHDAIDPVGFTIHYRDLKIGLCTDLGFPTTLVQHNLQHCNYLLLEANHEPHMVHACSRSDSYKQRVLSRIGHLSNGECGKLLKAVWHPGLQQICLAHLSSECNHPDVAKRTINALFENPPILQIALQEEVSLPFFW